MPAQSLGVPASPGGGLLNAARAASGRAASPKSGLFSGISEFAKKNPPLAAALAGAGGFAISSLMSGSGAEEVEFT
jgi:hypothetical protein